MKCRRRWSALAIAAMTTIIVLMVMPVASTVITIILTPIILIAWHMLLRVPVVLHEIDAFVAGVVFATMLAPVFVVARRYAHIYRRTIHRYALNHDRLTVKHSRLRRITDIDSAI